MLKKFALICVLALVCLETISQQSLTKTFTIGDTVPNIVFTHLINYKDSTASLSDFQGKLVILDFWATTCMTCVYSIPYIDSLQRQFDGKVQFLLVNPKISGDDLQRVQNVLRVLKSKKAVETSLPIVLFDEHAFALFPFRSLPNYVWIGPEGVVRGITRKSSVTRENISKILRGIDPCMPVKNDFDNN